MKTLLILICFLFLFGCNRNPDFSNPKDVVTNYQNLINKGSIKEAFELISDSSKNILTFQDFQEYYNLKYDSSIKANSFIIEDIRQMPINANFPDYRSYEFKELTISKITKDSIRSYYYVRVKNTGKNGWRIVWTKHLEKVAGQMEGKSKYPEVLSVCDKILHNDPLNGDAYLIKAWIYFRSSNNQMLEQTGSKLLDLEPKNPQSHIIMAAIYDTKGLYESAKISFQKALQFTSDPEEISQIYSNNSVICESLNQLDSAIFYLKRANRTLVKTHALWRLAKVYDLKNNNDSSMFYFNKALINSPMDNYLQVQLYCDFAEFLMRRAETMDKSSKAQEELYLKAKNVVLKALDLDPNDSDAKLILEKIKNKN